MRGVVYAVAAVVAGVLAVVLPDRLFPPDSNYRTLTVVGEAFKGVVLGGFRLALGAFAGLALAAGLAAIRGGGARRPVALVVAGLLAILVVGVSGFAFRGLSFFPKDGTLEERHRWAEMRLDRPYRETVAWAAASAAVRDAFGASPRFGPAAGARNAVLVGTREWTATFTLDVEGEKGRGRLEASMTLPFEPRDARPEVSATLEAEGRRVPLDSAGNATRR